MLSTIRSIISSFSPTPRAARLFIDASSFDPHQHKHSDHSVLILAHNAEASIYACVKQEQIGTAAVVVLDLGSNDATPFIAAQAGAIVILQGQETDEDGGLFQAMNVARRFADEVVVLEV